MKSVEQRWTRSDTIDDAWFRRSEDHGRTWSKPEPWVTGEKRPEGMFRRHPRTGYVDPRTGRCIEMWIEGVLPTDDPLEGMRQWRLFYSIDGGAPRQVIHKGAEYDAAHPLPGIWLGKNSAMIGDMPCVPVTARDGRILVPLSVSLIDGQGKLRNPGGGYTYHDSAFLIGTWHGKGRGSGLDWEMSEHVSLPLEASTRGSDEPTLAVLPDGRVMVLLRASNDVRPHQPGYRWVAFSSDHGRRWTKPVPWTYDTGENFFSPSACSQLVAHSSGRLFWLGNITPVNPRGNRPRYPFVMGEVDRRTGLLLKGSVRTVDDRGPGDHERMTLSNFYATEDRETREIRLHMTRMVALENGWQGDALLYRIPV